MQQRARRVLLLSEGEEGRTLLNAKDQGDPEAIPGFFTSFDCNEPAHVHVERDNSTCKFWLEPIELARSHGFNAQELNAIRRLINTHRTAILEAWHEHCG